jgi:hypothetical protein
MNAAGLESILNLSRRKTTELLDAIARVAEPTRVLGWRPGPGRAHIAWQLMHVAATEDRHLYVRMRGGEAKEPEFVRRFAGGSVPDDNVPPQEQVRHYVADRRRDLLELLRTLDDSRLATKPTPEAQWTYLEWFQVLAWHEAHHQGQAHLTLNLYRAANDPAMAKVGH